MLLGIRWEFRLGDLKYLSQPLELKMLFFLLATEDVQNKQLVSMLNCHNVENGFVRVKLSMGDQFRLSVIIQGQDGRRLKLRQ